jgi:hypothetical protein
MTAKTSRLDLFGTSIFLLGFWRVASRLDWVGVLMLLGALFVGAMTLWECCKNDDKQTHGEDIKSDGSGIA